MPKQFILALDQGTTGSRAILIDSAGNEAGFGYHELKQYYPKPGWVEHDPIDILASVRVAIKSAVSHSRIHPRQIGAIGITNQRESTVVWNRKTGRPCHRVIVWQGRRTADICDSLKRRKLEPVIHAKTGLVLDPYFSGSKIAWLLKQYPSLKSNSAMFGTMDTWLLWNLTGEHATDPTNASRTLLYDLSKLAWDKDLLKIFNVPPSMLPRIQNSGSNFGRTRGWPGLPDGIPVTAILGDQQAALYGQGCYGRGEMKNTYGTGCFLVVNTGPSKIFSGTGLLTTVASDSKGRPVYALEGSVFVAGALIQWLRDSMKWIKNARESEEIARSVEDSHGVTVVPAFTGLGAPYWDARARGAILGLTRGVKPAHIIRASLEAIAFQTADLVRAMTKDLKFPISSLKVDGGASRNNFLMEFQANVLGIPVLRSHRVESTAWGVGKLAGVTAGLWNDPHQLDRKIRFDIFRPSIKKSERNTLYKNWQEQLKRVLTHV